MTENEAPTSESSQEPTPSCCDGGSCCPSGTNTGTQRFKLIAFVLVVVAAGAVLANSLIRKSHSEPDQIQAGFATGALTETLQNTPATLDAEIKQAATQPSPWQTELSSLSTLNQAAADVDAVFVFVGTASDRKGPTLAESMNATLKTVQARGTRVGTYWLPEGSEDYENLSHQTQLPCVLAMVKGGGMAAVSNEINEAKLMQAYVTASRPPSACGPGGCGPSGCP